MKLKKIMATIVVLCASCFYALAQDVTIEAKNVRLEQILDQISDQTGCSFYYSRPTVNPDDIYSLSVKELDLSSTLSILFREKDVAFDIKNDKVYLTARKDTERERSDSANTVSGVIMDSYGVPLVGAAVLVKGTTTGTTTDENGKYVLEGVSPGDILEFVSIGFRTETMPVGGNRVINLTMQIDSNLLEETVIVGYGSQKKINLTGAVATVTGSEIIDRPSTNLSSMLQGLTPGLMVTQGAGTPGDDGATIRIRGVGTMNSASPYILVDGIETGTINMLDPNEIESISILKDASSAAIYGSKASNGVILITTKRGQEGKPKVSYSGNVNFSSPTTIIDRLSSYDYARMLSDMETRAGTTPRFDAEDIELFRNGTSPDTHPDMDYENLVWQTGISHKHNVTVSGGTQNVKYMVSGGYLDQQGTLKRSTRDQFNIRTNLDVKLSDKFSMHVNMSYIDNSYTRPNASTRGGMDMLILMSNKLAPWIPGKRTDGTYGHDGDGNPLAWLDANTTTTYTKRNFSGIASLDYEIIKDLKLTVQGSFVRNHSTTKDYRKEVDYGDGFYQGPTSNREGMSTWSRKMLDIFLNYEKTFNEAHHFKAMFGYNVERYDYWAMETKRQGFINTDLTDMNAGDASTQTNSGYTRDLALMSYFGRLNYDYKGKYLFEVNFRSDASSRFAKDYRWGYFPSVSAGWRITEEPWMASVKPYVQNIKLRASWGMLGNQNAIDDEYYPSIPALSLDKNYPFAGELHQGITVVDHKVESITWEKSATYGIGLDVTFLNDFTFSADLYNRLTTDIIMEVEAPWTFGISGSFQNNVGSMVNRGAEFNFSWNHIFMNGLRLGANANYAYNKNEILELSGVNEIVSGYGIKRIGEAYGSFYVYKTAGIFKSDEQAAEYEAIYGNPFGVPFKGGDLIIVDTNKDGKLTPDDRVVNGSNYPVHTFALGLNVGWKGFDLSVFFQGAANVKRYFNEEVAGFFGGDSSHPSTVWLDSWTPDNPNATWPRAYMKNDDSINNPNRVRTDFWCMDTSYLRIKSVNFSYTIPEKLTSKIGLDRIQIYYAGENLYTFDSLPFNIDPEVPSGQMNYYPSSMSHSIGLNITF